MDTTDGGRTNLDLLTVVKSAQVLSGEIVLAALLKKMLDIVLENAGAQRGVLLLNDEKDRLLLQAEIDLPRQQEAFMQNLPLEADISTLLPLPVIQYVARRQETVVLSDAQQPTQFSQSAYLQSEVVRSVFCMPLLRQGKLTGVLYLENNLAPNVFSPERTQLLNLLSSQLAISIENASLYEDLDNKVKQRTQEVLRQKEMLESQKSEIEEQNKKIRSSINYAQRIQQAMLLPDPEIRQLLPESFVLFRPRDVVSGDFYWIRRLGQKTWVAAVDCTGHGVPGALMSAIGHNLLNELLSIHQITEPDLLLNELHLSVRTALRQAENQNRDGMDIALVVIDHEREELHYAGAKNPLVYVQEGELQVIAGDRVPVGGYQHETERRFTKHIIPLRQNGQRIPTHFYLYSDGFADQFGGPTGRKFSSKRLQKLLHETHSFGAEHQKRNLEETLNAWMAQSRERQVDDVLLIGVKV
ncbi:MAG: GAF domain-containing protein [Microscillaceae bacterium]|nr:GAF domain-containing protein [Microscillaceae bacterium]